MLRKRSNRLLHKSISITIAFGAIVMLLSFSSCGGKKNTLGDAITERDSLPVMNTLGVTTLISDSGVTRYRVNTEEWTVYDRKKPSYWAFEKGVYLEQFDSIFNIEASIKADTAYYYDKQKLWKLIWECRYTEPERGAFQYRVALLERSNSKSLFRQVYTYPAAGSCNYRTWF